jgi:macrolide transport system ATP-binding/permease protein
VRPDAAGRKWLRMLWSRVRSLGRGAEMDDDLRDQIAAHIDEATQDYIEQGLAPEDARRAALLRFGSVAGTEEAVRDARGRWHQDLLKDVRYGLRSFRRNPGFAAIAVLSLAMGIGANTAIFSIVNSLMFRPRPVSDPDRLVELFVGEREHPYETTSYPSYVEFRDRNDVFTGLAAYGIEQFKLTAADEVEQVWGEVVSGNYFDVLGVRPLKGRMLSAGDDLVPGGSPVVVIGHRLWQRRFGADPDVIGRTVSINGHPLTVVGVAPAPYTGMFRGLSSEVWVPATVLPVLDPASERRLTSRGSRWLMLVGRLEAGVTVKQAQARFDLLTREMQANHPEEWKAWQEHKGYIRELLVSVLPESRTRIHPEMHAAAYGLAALLGAVVNMVLAIACMNLANMLLARAVVRRKEIAVRLAMGASRARIIRQLITESILLSLIAGVAGVALTVWLLDILVATMPAFPEGIRVAIDLRPDWRVFAYAAAFSTVTGVLFGLAPALKSSRTEVSTVLKDDSSATTGGHRRSRVRGALVVAQVAFSLLLLIGAGLVLRSLEKVRPTRLGFSSENMVVARLHLDESRYDRVKSQDFFRQVSERISSLPGVHSVSLVDGMPGGFMTGQRRGTQIEGYQFAPGESQEIGFDFVGPRYFTNMNIPVVQGRDFTERDRDGAPCVAIINQAFAARYLPGTGSALGKHLTKDEYRQKRMTYQCEIVGVIRDDRFQSLLREPKPFYFLAVMQSDRTAITMFVHTNSEPSTLVTAVRQTVRALDTTVPLNEVQTLKESYGTMAYPFRLLGFALIACGVMALLLATIGVYGIVSYSVAQRTREVGIRMALGAIRTRILGMLVGQGMTLVAWGLGIGLLLSFALTRVLTSDLFGSELLFGVTATDSLTFAGVTLILAVVALAACCIPAVRATRIDPVEALRCE